MQANYPPPAQLWTMAPHQFNEWRATNDIPALFAFLTTLLPGFSDWIGTLPFDHFVMMRIVPTGALFKGERVKVAIERAGDAPEERVYECHEQVSEDPLAYWKTKNSTAKVLGSFEPYFKWAKRTLRRDRFFTFDKANNSRADTFMYGSWTGVSPNDGVTSATLFREPNGFRVLKLGQVTLLRGVTIAPRNLDFVDLDYLTILGDFHGSYRLEISFSSCRDMTIKNANIAFFTFNQCFMDKFSCEKSKIQDFYFKNTDVLEFRLSETFAYRLGFTNSTITPFIEGCELREVKFQPSSHAPANQIATTFRLLRSAFQRSGMRREAATCYYNERVFERKSEFRPYLNFSNNGMFPPMPYGGSLLTVFRTWYRGRISDNEILPAVRQTILSRLKLWLHPKYLSRLVYFKIRWLASLLECLVWGYGERPSRIFACAILLIGLYTGIYHNTNWQSKAPPNWIDSIYFSLVTFSTLGYGDILPTTTQLKLLCGSEAILGAFTMGLVVAGFSNRSKY
ncbi:MAG: two pore domain potassium channel family protein [Paraburkholderia sp.]|uniref:potassium channel family protein n=1 Tax=Paraburkholderia sp. TaxID=1926495 RepID=UPI001227E763|nr:potassium channel family protein [Paraburkholderia sp.]TAL96062.1 MAG: two pore domain potassium channel family protein [Paraburkholderia sp.]